MSKHIAILSVAVAGMLCGCMMHEQAYATTPVYVTPSVQANVNYPLYYADGVYWAYQNDAWYWWSDDHWITSTYAPHSTVLVHGGYGGAYHGSSHHSSLNHGSSHHGSSHHGSSHHGIAVARITHAINRSPTRHGQ